MREEGLIDVEGLAGVSHSPERRGGVREKEEKLHRPALATPPGRRSWSCARARARAAAWGPYYFLLYSYCFLTLFSLLECRAELGRLVGY